MALRELTIRNFAIIKHLEVEIGDGLTVVTGETGAGKSIVLDALDLLLGSRAEANLIRHDEEQCEISALFDIQSLPDVRQWLELKDLLGEEDSAAFCLIRRIVRRNKPTKCYINDQPATLSSLRELGLLLVDLHGQHEHQSLLRLATQRQIIDQFAGHHDQLSVMAKLAAQILRLRRELASASQSHHDNADRLELLSFQLNELDETAISEGEFEQLEQEHARLSNAQELISGIQATVDALYEKDSSNVSEELGRAVNELEGLAEVDVNLAPAVELLNSALAHVDEARTALTGALSHVELDPERLAEVEARRDTLINLARKHRCNENQLPERHQALQAEYQRLSGEDQTPAKLSKELETLSEQYHKVASAVSAQRQETAAQLSALISEQMQDLGMRGGKLDIQVEPIIDDQLHVSENGLDQIDYLVSTNHGVPLKPLQKTASGGELSRISLAIQVITSKKSATPTLVFDEVDVGVGGKIAAIIGQRLRDLGSNAQVICITHLPQVAAKGQQHLFVDKISDQKDTHSTLIELGEDLRIAEIARMLGGSQITDRTRAHAEEMLAQAGNTE
ncbi:MAG: DNA repair protein RecN [Gammaproteobacteria bacterium]|nr:DNA repair protein RecN [Gammaproteobacteria bacterium]